MRCIKLIQREGLLELIEVFVDKSKLRLFLATATLESVNVLLTSNTSVYITIARTNARISTPFDSIH